MAHIKTKKSKTKAAGATLVLAGTLVPQVSEATIVTVGGDGAMGTSTISLFGTSNIGGLLLDPITNATGFSDRQYLFFQGASSQPFGNAYRSNASESSAFVPGSSGMIEHYFSFIESSSDAAGAILGSSDNWVPGHFRVNGVNGGNRIYGWLQLELPALPKGGDVTIHSFTYDDAATGTTPFTKPVGGFAVPEPSSFACLLALGAAGVLANRAKKFVQDRAVEGTE